MRITIIGNSGSGKSTLAYALGKELNLPVFYLDKQLLHSNFEKKVGNNYFEEHKRLINKDQWIIEGNYRSVLPERIRRSTLVIFLDINRFFSIYRAYKRSLDLSRSNRDIPIDAVNKKIDIKFFKFMLTYSRKKMIKELDRHCKENNVPLLILKSKPVDDLINDIKKSINY